MPFGDDELPPAISSSAGPKPIRAERVRLVAHSSSTAPMEQNRQQVLLELIDSSSAVERSGLDLVAVLDVSGSMSYGGKIDKMKTAMKFVISKLGPLDRLSIVSFSTRAEKRCPLHCMNRDSQEKLKDFVDKGLHADGSTNMKEGLETGLEVLAGRRHSDGRVGSIILMSDGEQDQDSDATAVNIGNVAVYTFGFGEDNDAKVLGAIASNSQGGTFYFVRDGESLSEHFSQILAGLLSVVVQDLKLIVWQHRGHSTIEKVDAGAYPQTPDAADGSFTVSFGDLYSGEVRKVIVDLLLPAVGREYRATVLFANCWCRTRGEAFYYPLDYLKCVIHRTVAARPGAMKPEVKDELVRRRYADTLRVAAEEATAGDFNGAHRKLEESQKELEVEQTSNPMIDDLRNELRQLLNLANLSKWKEFLACLWASWTSHVRQRYAARGDVQGGSRIFATPRMRKYKKQAEEFDKDPNMQLPSVEDDVKEEAAAETVVMERAPVVDQPQQRPRIWGGSWERSRMRSSGWAWAMVILCTVLAVGLILAGVAVFAVYLLYKPKMPYLVVSDAQLGQLQYGQDGAIHYLQMSITILAENNNSKADASFSRVDLALGFHGADVALLRAEPFVVARESSLPLQYNVVSAGEALDPAGMQAMDEALKAGMVPLDLFGKARTRWKVGVFVKVRFWTRISCRLRFFFPGNGTVMLADRQRCRSRVP